MIFKLRDENHETVLYVEKNTTIITHLTYKTQLLIVIL